MVLCTRLHSTRKTLSWGALFFFSTCLTNLVTSDNCGRIYPRIERFDRYLCPYKPAHCFRLLTCVTTGRLGCRSYLLQWVRRVRICQELLNLLDSQKREENTPLDKVFRIDCNLAHQFFGQQNFRLEIRFSKNISLIPMGSCYPYIHFSSQYEVLWCGRYSCN